MNEDSELDWSDVDPDDLLVTKYFGGELSPAEAAEVEDRVIDDDEFFAKMGLLIEGTLLQMRIPHRGMRTALAERRVRITEDLFAIRIARSLRPDFDEIVAEELLAESMPESDVPAKAGGGSVTDIGPRLKADDVQRRWMGYARRAWKGVERAAVAAMILAALSSVPLALRLQSVSAALEEERRNPGTSAGTGTHNAAVEVNVARDAAPWVVDLPNGARATVMPGSRISYDTGLVRMGGALLVRLDGEASFEVPSQPISIGVFTSTAATALSGGDFAVRSSGSGSETLITARGRARVTRVNGPTDQLLDVTSGFIRVSRNERPALVTQGIDKFPKLPRQ